MFQGQGLAHGPECFIEVEGDEDMDLEAITNAARSSVSRVWRMKNPEGCSKKWRCQVERANGDLSLKMRT